MGAHQSKAMQKARKLVESGMSAYQAANESGITRSAIYMSAWYKALKATIEKPKRARR